MVHWGHARPLSWAPISPAPMTSAFSSGSNGGPTADAMKGSKSPSWSATSPLPWQSLQAVNQLSMNLRSPSWDPTSPLPWHSPQTVNRLSTGSRSPAREPTSPTTPHHHLPRHSLKTTHPPPRHHIPQYGTLSTTGKKKESRVSGPAPYSPTQQLTAMRCSRQ
jgi:hypothetical protein